MKREPVNHMALSPRKSSGRASALHVWFHPHVADRMEEILLRDPRARSVRIVPVAILALALVVAFVPAASAHPGDLDSTFGTGGWTGVTLLNGPEVAGIIRRPDASLIAGSNISGEPVFQTEGLTKNGDPLPGYGISGVGTVVFPGAPAAYADDVAAEPDGRAIVAGYTIPSSGTEQFAVARFRLNGAPDTSFSGDGAATFRFPQGNASGYGVAVQPDGKIVMVGEVDPANEVSNPAVIRVNPNGTLDKTFGDKGRKVLKVPDHVAAFDSPWRVAIGAAGDIVMAGWEERVHASNKYRTLVMRLRPNGSPDPTFSGDGFVLLAPDPNDYAQSMALDGSKIVLGLETNSQMAGFMRLLGNGRRDPTFGGGDGLVLRMLSIPWGVGGLAVTSDHRIVATDNRAGDPEVVRLHPGGHLDLGFGLNGQATGLVPGSEGDGLRILPVGKIVVVGSSGNRVIVTRFLGG
jgi:uncharacterized delta-60 repeat protein